MEFEITLFIDDSIEPATKETLEKEQILDRNFLKHCCRLAHLTQNKPMTVSLAIVNSDKIRQLNWRYRKKNKSTNVLSFRTQLPSDFILKAFCLGDIILCPEVIALEAKMQGKVLKAHWAHLLIHGMLHLQNYDHIDPKGTEQMESLEIQLLHQIGYANPYEELQ